ncbi:cysteine-rich with EGF-like domain protein 2 [Leguminivora glycinivorella]|uniref:cysteine-rich with EGF-like domain protein 2 n=1 Tax=Leguminivora glycinivorella TaxID=1035111 RepID=UPI0020106BB5|nr:cysteine-rich with EGF-like domain protein 2 [Leguminivora glycinivorella]
MKVFDVNILSLVLQLLFIHKTICKKISLPDIDLHSAGKVDDCQKCRILTDSFSHWLTKTKRGKYEGGDAAWEEAKLKSYGRSEMRLVEIQEGLCSEVKKHQDQCYSLAEEAEQPLEKWWFHEDPDSVDLYTWLCIETLQHCCPENHFGESCSPCPLHKNKICGGRGKCAGEGTRKGNGTCICDKQFAGVFCDDCAKNYYKASEDSCEQCHKACAGCSGDGPAACTACKKGWELQSGTCVDINECLTSSSCKANQYCVNHKGSYSCKKCHDSCKTCTDAGASQCTSCESNSVLWDGMCVDDQQRSDLLQNALKRLALYCGLLIITYFTYRKSRMLASLVMIVIAIYIYYSEGISRITLIDLFFKLYLTNSQSV